MTDTPVNHRNGIPQQPASGVQTNTTNFDGNLSASDGTVQSALETIDDMATGGPGSDTTAIHDNTANEIAAITAKATPTLSDYLVIEDAAAANAKKSITIGAIPNFVGDSGAGGADGFVPAPSAGDAAANKYLKADGTWAAVSAGGASYFDATVGATGADYTTVSAALTAGYVNLLMVDDTTETADIAVPATGYSIYIPQGFTWNTATYKHTYSATANVYVDGGGVAQMARAVNVDLFENGSYPSSVVYWNGVEIDENGIVANNFSNGQERITNMTFRCPENGSTFAGTGSSYYRGIVWVGESTSCDKFLGSTSGDVVVSDVHLTGTVNGSLFSAISHNGGSISISNMTIDVSANATIGTSNCTASIGGLVSDGSTIKFVHQGSGNIGVNGCDMNGGTVDVTSTDNSQFSNLRDVGTLDLTDTGSTNLLITNARVTNAVTVGGDRHKLVNCEFLGGVTVNSGADDNAFGGCQFGADAGGGSNTLTINSGSNRTRVWGCMSDAAISDSGTGSAISADTNTVY